MTIDELIAMLQASKLCHGGDMDVTVLQYNGGDDVPCDVTDAHLSQESGTLQLETKYRD